MPNRNGTGPGGKGAKTGRALGACGDGTPRGVGRGKGFRAQMGLRRNVAKEDESKDKNN